MINSLLVHIHIIPVNKIVGTKHYLASNILGGITTKQMAVEKEQSRGFTAGATKLPNRCFPNSFQPVVQYEAGRCHDRKLFLAKSGHLSKNTRSNLRSQVLSVAFPINGFTWFEKFNTARASDSTKYHFFSFRIIINIYNK